MTKEVYLNHINGQWLHGSLEKWADRRNPANPSEVLGQVTLSSIADVNAAINSAAKAQAAWSKVPRPSRGQFLFRAAQIIRDSIDEFSRTITREEGKNLSEARGEVLKSIHTLEFTASESRRPVGQVIPSEMPNTFLYTLRAPLGVVGIITPWNFPLCIPAWKIGPALLEGNSVVFKPSTLTPGIACKLVQCFEKAGLPQGVLNLVFGNGSTVGNAIVHNQRVKAISFTGSNEVGTALNSSTAPRLARTQLEMGGKNPILILADADLDQAVEACVQGAFGSTGQRCTATSRVIVEKSVYLSVKEKLLARIRKIKVGDGLEDPEAMGPLVDEKQFFSVLESIENAKKEGATLLCGGEAVGTHPPHSGYFIAPTLFDQVPLNSQLAKEEVFGPVLALIQAGDFAEAVQIANSVEYGLSSSVYTRDIHRVMQYVNDVETGILHINSPTVGGEVQAPFGGMKSTGLGGREMGSTGPEFFCDIKTVYIDTNSTVRQGNLY